MLDKFDPADRGQFLNLAALSEGALIVLALGLGWIAGIDPLRSILWNWESAGWGVAATVPMFLLFVVFYRFPVGPMLEIKRFLVEMLGPSLHVCRWYDLILLGMVAGFAEELLFRGLLQPWFGHFGFLAGLIASNVIFGLAHLITPTYAIIAAVIGVYLGLLPQTTDPPNVSVPIISHALYDYLAFLVVVRTYRSELRDEQFEDAEIPDESDSSL